VVGWLFRKSSDREAPLRPGHLPRLLGVALSGAFLAPVALAYGLARTSGMSASLMLNMEAVFTVILGAFLYQEQLGRRVLLAMAMLIGGGALLAVDRSAAGEASLIGILAVLAATLAWALDNALARPLADVDPSRVIFGKCVIGAALSLVLSIEAHEAQAPAATVSSLLLIGATGYGLSLRLYYLAQRRLGAARTASVFAAGPFLGALVAAGLGEPLGGVGSLLGAAMMIGGVALHLTESHQHEHAHEAIEHEHAHRHDDGHHDHVHEPMPEGEHSHLHRHEERVHSHPHAADVHHRHEH
jgi:drug/metabolite transporter (DMT)-like permease